MIGKPLLEFISAIEAKDRASELHRVQGACLHSLQENNLYEDLLLVGALKNCLCVFSVSFSCDFCPKTFFERTLFYGHARKHHLVRFRTCVNLFSS